MIYFQLHLPSKEDRGEMKGWLSTISLHVHTHTHTHTHTHISTSTDTQVTTHTHTHTHTHTYTHIYVNGYTRSEEHTSELQSHLNLVCRPLREKTHNEARLT